MSTTARKANFTLTEAADFLCLSKSTIRQLIASKTLTAYRPTPRKLILKLEDLERFLTRNPVGEVPRAVEGANA
ncbi:helix-turn-helix domain-containing protein [Anatilimnocola floriformis]|uniref:helix-turn-helix domain-containing protein n=1 Tax=Anatilimnocola floriformis TaxID=2948575 RepID=UPI0020C59F93|nr:helix-turn-helix domain-containing protein [Anatilimnocola floriformis]